VSLFLVFPSLYSRFRFVPNTNSVLPLSEYFCFLIAYLIEFAGVFAFKPPVLPFVWSPSDPSPFFADSKLRVIRSSCGFRPFIAVRPILAYLFHLVTPLVSPILNSSFFFAWQNSFHMRAFTRWQVFNSVPPQLLDLLYGTARSPPHLSDRTSCSRTS